MPSGTRMLRARARLIPAEKRAFDGATVSFWPLRAGML